jgi:hypothetical protein
MYHDFCVGVFLQIARPDPLWEDEFYPPFQTFNFIYGVGVSSVSFLCTGFYLFHNHLLKRLPVPIEPAFHTVVMSSKWHEG